MFVSCFHPPPGGANGFLTKPGPGERQERQQQVKCVRMDAGLAEAEIFSLRVKVPFQQCRAPRAWRTRISTTAQICSSSKPHTRHLPLGVILPLDLQSLQQSSHSSQVSEQGSQPTPQGESVLSPHPLPQAGRRPETTHIAPYHAGPITRARAERACVLPAPT